jgi:hypothetical protein
MKAMIGWGIIVSFMVISCPLFYDGFDEAEFKRERAAWEAQGLRHYRFVTTERSEATGASSSVKITVFPDREPELISPELISNDEFVWRPYYGETIDQFYQFIANDKADSKGAPRHFVIRYSHQYHYPIYYSSSMQYPWVGGSSEIEITEFEPLGE